MRGGKGIGYVRNVDDEKKIFVWVVATYVMA